MYSFAAYTSPEAVQSALPQLTDAAIIENLNDTVNLFWQEEVFLHDKIAYEVQWGMRRETANERFVNRFRGAHEFMELLMEALPQEAPGRALAIFRQLLEQEATPGGSTELVAENLGGFADSGCLDASLPLWRRALTHADPATKETALHAADGVLRRDDVSIPPTTRMVLQRYIRLEF